MIEFNYETSFIIENEERLSDWIEGVIKSEDYKAGDINYIFCDDKYLHKLNLEFLKHDTLTDVISFDYRVGKRLHGDIFISIERVRENALELDINFADELHRGMVHGILHYCEFSDKTKKETIEMRDKENFYLAVLAASS